MQLHPIKIFLVSVILLSSALMVFSQDGPRTASLNDVKTAPPPETPTTAVVMRDRIAKAKAYLVVKNYGAAIYELENIRRETDDPTVHRVLNVLLMHSYLEQGDYKKAQSFLTELQKDPAKTDDYFAVAGQVINGARTQLARYHALGISVSDSKLPEQAVNDLNSMRETLEMVVDQAKVIGKRKEVAPTAIAILEESSSARGNLARDAYDERRWKDQVADAREQIVNPRSRIINAMQQPVEAPEIVLVATTAKTDDVESVTETPDKEVVADTPKQKENPAQTPKSTEPSFKPVVDESARTTRILVPGIPSKSGDALLKTETATVRPSDRKVKIIGSEEKKPSDEMVGDKKSDEDSSQPNVKSTDQTADTKKSGNDEKNAAPATETVADSNDGSPMPIGSLVSFATKKVTPVYPRQARTMRMSGTVKVEVTVDEDGRVATVENTSGPVLLKQAALDAIRKWEFTPFVRDGQPVKATGFVSFNFNL